MKKITKVLISVLFIFPMLVASLSTINLFQKFNECGELSSSAPVDGGKEINPLIDEEIDNNSLLNGGNLSPTNIKNDTENADDGNIYIESKYYEDDFEDIVPTGSGTEEDPYLVGNLNEWLYLSGQRVKENETYKFKAGDVVENSTLPENLTQVEYIESVGNSYINTGILVSSSVTDISINMEVAYTNLSTRQLMGYSGQSSGYWGVRNGFFELGGTVTTIEATVDKKYTISQVRSGDTTWHMSVDGVEIAEKVDTTSGSYQLFALQNGYRNNLKMYSCQIYVAGELVRNFVPCISEGFVCLYDTINNKLHFNGLHPSEHLTNYFKDSHVKLTDNIVLNDGSFDDNGNYVDGGDGCLYLWDSVDAPKHLDGQGYSIVGAKLYNGKLFNNFNGVTIKNINFNLYSNTWGIVDTVSNSIFDGVSVSGYFKRSAFAQTANDCQFLSCTSNAIIDNNNGVWTSLSAGYVTTANRCLFKYSKSRAELENLVSNSYSAGFTVTSNGSEFWYCENNSYFGEGAATCALCAGMSAINKGNTKFFYCKNYQNTIEKSYQREGGIAGENSDGTTYFYRCENYGKCAYGISSSTVKGDTFVECKNYGGCHTGISKTNGSLYKCENYAKCSYAIAQQPVIVEDCVNYADNCSSMIGTLSAGGRVARCINKGNNVSNAIVGSVSASLVENCINYGTAGTMFGGANSGAIIDNCINYASTANASAGIVNNLYDGLISNCKNYGDLLNGQCGGIVRNISGSGTIINCVNYGNVKDNGNSSAGGIVGGVSCKAIGSVSIANSENYGNIYAVHGFSSLGGIVGTTNAGLNIQDCRNHGKIYSSSRSGGILGKSTGAVNIEECINNGEIKANNSGGISGEIKQSTIKDCINLGKINSSGNVGMLMFGGDGNTLINCINQGDITGGKTSPSLLYYSGENTIQNCIIDAKLSDFTLKRAFGINFKAFYRSWRTGKIGLNSIDGNGFFQDEVTTKSLYDLGYYTDDQKTEYVMLDYIQSSGSQYIDTGLFPNSKMRIDIKTQSSSDYSVFGGLGLGSPLFNLTGNGTRSFRWGNQTWNGSGISCQTINQISFGQQIYVDGVLKKEFTYYDWTSTCKLILFGRNANTSGGVSMDDSGGTVAIFSCKIYDNDVLVRDFIPVMRSEDGVIGLYDKENKVFYENKGSGSFVAGSIIGYYN